MWWSRHCLNRNNALITAYECNVMSVMIDSHTAARTFDDLADDGYFKRYPKRVLGEIEYKKRGDRGKDAVEQLVVGTIGDALDDIAVSELARRAVDKNRGIADVVPVSASGSNSNSLDLSLSLAKAKIKIKIKLAQAKAKARKS